MDKHTATHTCTYDTHVNRMKDGKSWMLNKKSCDLFQPEFYPSAPNVGFFSSDGILKKQQKISFLKQNKRGKKSHLTSKGSLRAAWQSEPETYY